MNAFPGMDATPPDDFDAALAERGRRAQRILIFTMALMIGAPTLLFVLIHIS